MTKVIGGIDGLTHVTISQLCHFIKTQCLLGHTDLIKSPSSPSIGTFSVYDDTITDAQFEIRITNNDEFVNVKIYGVTVYSAIKELDADQYNYARTSIKKLINECEFISMVQTDHEFRSVIRAIMEC